MFVFPILCSAVIGTSLVPSVTPATTPSPEEDAEIAAYLDGILAIRAKRSGGIRPKKNLTEQLIS
jgi:hypothetical protein